MQAEKRGSQWDIIMNVIIDSGKFLNKSDYTYSDEFSTIDFLNRKDDIWYGFIFHCFLRLFVLKQSNKFQNFFVFNQLAYDYNNGYQN